jgi:hypothetical protein
MRRAKRPVVLVSRGDDIPLELDVRIARGAESAATRELEELGARVLAVRPAGELRVAPSGPLRAYLTLRNALAVYAVRPLPGVELRDLDRYAGVQGAQELASLVLTLDRQQRLTSMRITAGPELRGDRTAIARLSDILTRRLGVKAAAISPDLVLIVRERPEGGLEIAARLPLTPRETELPPRRDPPPVE